MKAVIAIVSLVALIGVSAAFGFWLGRSGRWWVALLVLGVMGFGGAIAVSIGGQIGGIKGANASLSAMVFGGPVWIGIAAGALIGYLRQGGEA
jgi:lipopolysaccharide export LptBFGC system permease protein LptF